MRKIICFGPGPKFKGGIADYNTALAKALDRQEGIKVSIVSWSQQYPSIIPRDFIDHESKTNFMEGTNIDITYITNYNKPSTWKQTATLMAQQQPDKVIFQWAIAIQGLPIAKIAARLKKLCPSCEILFDLHFVIQKEHSAIDKYFTKMALTKADNFIVHAEKTATELKTMFPNKRLVMSYDGKRSTEKESNTIIKLFHPIYDLFKPDPAFDVQQFKAQHHLAKHVFLFFGFIRKYKGLHYAIEAFAKVAQERKDVSFLICGESFWKTLDQTKWSTKLKQTVFGLAKKILLNKKDDEQNYNPLALIDKYQLQDRVMVVNKFIANEEVYQYFQVSDAVVLFYEYATPSGIESLSYNFAKPLLATNVGHFPETIEDGYNGYLAQATSIDDMARVMLKFLDHPLPSQHVTDKTAAMSWDNYAKAIVFDLQ